MRKILLLAVTAVMVFMFFQYKNIQKREQAVARIEEERQQFAIDRAEWVKTQNNLRVECEKGGSAFYELTQIKATYIQEPKCGIVYVR